MHVPHCEDHPPDPAKPAEQITVQLDRLSRAALAVLTADGTDATEAVPAAVIDTAERHSEPPALDSRDHRVVHAFEDQLVTSVAAAPPLTDYQASMLTSAFVHGHSSWLSEGQWRALHDNVAVQQPTADSSN